MDNIWGTANYNGMLVVTGLFCFSLRKRVGWIAAALWGWTLISCLTTFQFPQASFPGLALNFDYTTGQAFSQALMIPLAIFFCPDKMFRHWRVLASLLVLFEMGLIIHFGYGLQNAVSHDGALLAALVPFLPLPLQVVTVVFLLFIRGATAFAILAAELVVALIYWNKVSGMKKAIAGVASLATFLLVAWLSQGAKLINDSERIQTWVRSMTFWREHHIEWRGAGVGTFQWLGPWIQCTVERCTSSTGIFLQMHNDWLQILFEAGIIGLGLTVLFYLQMILRARRSPKLLAGLLGFGAFGMTYHPLRFFASALFLVILIREVLEGEEVDITGKQGTIKRSWVTAIRR